MGSRMGKEVASGEGTGEDQFKTGASFSRYAEDEFETKKFIEKDSHQQTTKKEPIVWKVKCMVGQERYSAFCLMHKFVDLRSLGEKLKIVSALSVDHVKGHIFIEADKQPEVHEDRQGIAKQIYRGGVFAPDENEVEKGGYVCFKAQLCEKGKLEEEVLVGKDGETSFCGVDDLPSTPKSPLSPKTPWQARENKNDCNQGDRDGPFSIGQTLRIIPPALRIRTGSGFPVRNCLSSSQNQLIPLRKLLNLSSIL